MRQATQRGLALAKQVAVRCRLVSVIRDGDAAPQVAWPSAIQEPPRTEGHWAEWAVERDRLPDTACTPNRRRTEWSMAGQETGQSGATPGRRLFLAVDRVRLWVPTTDGWQGEGTAAQAERALAEDSRGD
ncbi:MAG: hypothetical protein ACOYB3_07730 [Azonexus sp.]